MSFPSNLDEMFAAGYEYVRAETCPDCGLDVEVYLTPGKRELLMEPMCGEHSPAVRHLEVCTPLPASKDELLKVGYTLAKRIPCPVCNRAIEAYTHASRPELWLNPMMGGDWPVVMHRCNISAKEGRKDGPTVVQDDTKREPIGAQFSEVSQIKLHAVRDPNYQLLAVGWQDGTLVCQFKTAKWSYAGVPEAEFLKLMRVPYAYSIFTKNIKGKYPATKME